MTSLPIRFETYHPGECPDPRCERCGGRMTVLRPRYYDDPFVIICKPCTRIDREIRERMRREAPIRRFEDNGRMLRWWIDNYTGAAAAQAWIRLMGLILETDSTAVEAARWRA